MLRAEYCATVSKIAVAFVLCSLNSPHWILDMTSIFYIAFMSVDEKCTTHFTLWHTIEAAGTQNNGNSNIDEKTKPN